MADVASLGIRVDATEAERARETLDRLAGQGAETEQSLRRMATRAAVGAGALAAALAGVAIAGNKSAQEIARFAAVANATTDQFQQMAAGATLFGGNADQLADQLKDVNDRIGDFLTTGGGPMADLFDQIGPSVGVTAEAFRELSGPDALLLFVDTLERAGVSQQEVVFQLEGMASELAHLYPLLRNNGELLRLLGTESQRLGAVLDADAIRASNELAAAQWLIEQSAQGVKNQITEALTPALVGVATAFADVAAEGAAADVVADSLRTTVQWLAKAAVGVTTSFELAGNALAGFAALAEAAVTDTSALGAGVRGAINGVAPGLGSLLGQMEAAGGGVSATLDTIQADMAATTERAAALLAQIDAVGAGGAGTGETADKVRQIAEALEAMRAGRGGGVARTPLAQVEADARAAEAALSEAARAAEQNAGTVAALQEQLAQAALPARELAQRQAELRLNEYATPEQVAQVRELAGALADVQARAEAGREFERIAGGLRAPAETGELASITASYDDRRAIIQAALDDEYLTAEQHAEAMLLLEQQTAERRAAVTQQLAEQQQQAAMQGMASAVSITQQQIGVLSGLFAEGSAAGRAFFGLSQGLAAANAVIQGIQAAMAIRVAYAQMAAMTGPAAPAVLAAGETHAQIVQGLGFVSAGMIMGQTIASYDGGGYTGDGPRMGGLDGRGGRLAVLHPQETVVDHTRGQRLGGTVNQTINIAGRVDNRTAQQIARASAREQRIAEARR